LARIALHVVCKACGRLFDTNIRTDPESFRKGTFAANYHTCPSCGATETYRKAEYVPRDVRTGKPAERP
jgi:rRNA maturation endonuclease Nob1